MSLPPPVCCASLLRIFFWHTVGKILTSYLTHVIFALIGMWVAACIFCSFALLPNASVRRGLRSCLRLENGFTLLTAILVWLQTICTLDCPSNKIIYSWELKFCCSIIFLVCVPQSILQPHTKLYLECIVSEYSI